MSKNKPQLIGSVNEYGHKDYTQSMSQDIDGILTATLVYQGGYHKVAKTAKAEKEHPEYRYLKKTNWGIQRLQGNLGRATVTYKGCDTNDRYIRYKLKSSTRTEPIETHPHFLNGKEIPSSAGTIQTNKAYGYKFGEEIANGEPKGSRQAFYDTVDTNRAFKLFPKKALFNLGGVTNFIQLGMVVQAIIVTNANEGFETSIGSDFDKGGYAYKVGQIVNLPDEIDIKPKVNIAAYPNQYSWLVTACSIDILGGAMRQEVEFSLSGPKGWNRLIYQTA